MAGLAAAVWAKQTSLKTAQSPEMQILQGNPENISFETFDLQADIYPGGAKITAEYVLVFKGSKSEKFVLKPQIGSYTASKIDVYHRGHVAYQNPERNLSLNFGGPNEKAKIILKYDSNISFKYLEDGKKINGTKINIVEPLTYAETEKQGEAKKALTIYPSNCVYNLSIPEIYEIKFGGDHDAWTKSEAEYGIIHEFKGSDVAPTLEISGKIDITSDPKYKQVFELMKKNKDKKRD